MYTTEMKTSTSQPLALKKAKVRPLNTQGLGSRV